MHNYLWRPKLSPRKDRHQDFVNKIEGIRLLPEHEYDAIDWRCNSET
jgi:hypothetical protein